MRNNITDEEIDEMIINPKKGRRMLQDKLLDTPSISLENDLSDIIDKSNDILKLEKVHFCLNRICTNVWIS